MNFYAEVDWHESEMSGMRLSYGYNIQKAVKTIDDYCHHHGDNCFRCPLRRTSQSGQYVCAVVHKKWDSAGFKKKKEHFNVSWGNRKQILENNGWSQVSFGPNVLWYKHRNYKEQKALKNCSDEEFFSIVEDTHETKRRV